MDTLQLNKVDYFQPHHPEIIPQNVHPSNVAAVALEVGVVAMKLADIDRKPRYTEHHRENDSEHSEMLTLTSIELAAKLYPGRLDIGLVAQMASVHELMETKTGDMPTFLYSSQDMAAKRIAEQAALAELLQELPPYLAYLVGEYESQSTPEARFVKAVDKLMPVLVDILGYGKKVMTDDYGVTTAQQLRTAHQNLHNRIADSFSEFPDIVDAHELLCGLFALEFEATPTH